MYLLKTIVTCSVWSYKFSSLRNLYTTWPVLGLGRPKYCWILDSREETLKNSILERIVKTNQSKKTSK